MRLNYRMAVNLFEAAEATGIRREELTVPLGLDAGVLTDPRVGIDWDTLVSILARLSEMVGDDIERLRAVGRKMVSVPSYYLFRGLGRSVFSLKNVYVAGERWVALVSIPHLVLKTTFPSEERMHFRCTIPEPYAPSAPYLHVFEGLLCAVPTIIDLPQAAIASTSLTPRELDITLDLPPSRSLVERAKSVARAAFHRADVLDLVEAERQEIAESLAAVKRSTAEMSSLFDRLPDIVVIHREGTIVWLNRAAVKTFGYQDTSDLVGRRLIELFHSSAHAVAGPLVHGPVDDENAPDLIEVKLVARDLSPVLVEVSPARSVPFGGKESCLFVARDVTERKRLQQQLLIADRLASVGMLAAGVAHEVNNPLAYVLNNIEIARRELAPLGEEVQASRAALDVALEGVERIRTIIRELLVLARVDDAAIGPVDVGAIVESTLALATPQIAERAKLVCELGSTPLALGTASRVGQVLLNLIANALEAMSPAKRATNVLRVVVGDSPAGGAVIEVSDTGAGIAPEHAARVFEPFFTTKSLGKGTGLGLAISQRLIAEIGGELAFESTPSVGTTFRITLAPADRAAVAND